MLLYWCSKQVTNDVMVSWMFVSLQANQCHIINFIDFINFYKLSQLTEQQNLNEKVAKSRWYNYIMYLK